MQYCKLNNTACKLPTCKNGEKITGVDSDSDDHELEPCIDIKSFEWHAGEMTEEQFEQWKKGSTRFFEPRNSRWKITTEMGVYEGRGKLPNIITECNEMEIP